MQSVPEHIQIEEREGFQSKQIYDEYSQKIERGKREYIALIDDLIKKDKKIVGYGASATSTTLMYHYDMDGTLEYLVDDFDAKQGLYSPGLHIPVYHPDKIYEDKPDYIVVLAWRYHEKIMQKHQKFLNEGGHFILPLPELKII